MRISRHWDTRRKASAEDVEDGPDSTASESSWRRILHPLKLRRHSTSTNGTLLQCQTSGHSTGPSGPFPQTPRSSIDITAYYSAKPLPLVPSPGFSSSKAYTARSKVWYTLSSDSSSPSSPSSPSRSTTTCSSPVLRPQQHERLILTPTSRYPVDIAGHIYEPEDCAVPKKKHRQNLARKFSSKCLRTKPDIKELPPPPPLPRRMNYDDCLV